MAHFVLHLTYWCDLLNVRPTLDYMPGLENDWADELSRVTDPTMLGWHADRRIDLSLHDLLYLKGGQLYPSDQVGSINERFRAFAGRIAKLGPAAC